MYEINIRLERIDYDKTINSLLPGIIKKCSGKDDRNMIFRLLAKLDDTALVIARDILALITEKDKMELLKCLVNFYDSDLTSVINRMLKEHIDEGAELGGLVVRDWGESQLQLVLCNAKINFSSLVNKLPAAVAMMLKPLMRMGSDGERSILRFAQQNKYIWGTLISKLESKLHEKGFYLYIQDIEITEGSTALNAFNHDRKFALSEELEETIIDAVSVYLKARCK